MQYTTYYKKRIWELFKQEPKKSELVNKLLAEHYLKKKELKKEKENKI